MRLRKWAVIALGFMLVFALFLSGCDGNLIPPEDPDVQEPADNNNPDDEPGDPGPTEPEPPSLTEAGWEDLESLPYSIIYRDKNDNLVQLDLSDKTRTVLVENVAVFVPDWANHRIALAIPDPDEEIAEQGVAEIALYSTTDGSLEVLGTSYMGYGLHFSPNGRFLGVKYGIGGLQIYDLELGERYDADEENLQVCVNYLPVWAPDGMVYAMPRIFYLEKAGPQGIYIVDPVSGEKKQVLEVEDRVARPHSWLDEDRLLIEYEPEQYTWVDEGWHVVGLGKDYQPGEFKVLDINTKELTEADAPDYSWQAPKYESPDGTWVLYEVFIDHKPQGRIKLHNSETNTVYSIAEGYRPLWFEDE